MPKRISKKKRDENETAAAVVKLATDSPSTGPWAWLKPQPSDKPLLQQSQISKSLLSQVMSEMGRKGGKIGGKRRLETMSAKERSKIAKKAANARWNPKP